MILRKFIGFFMQRVIEQSRREHHSIVNTELLFMFTTRLGAILVSLTSLNDVLSP